MYVFDDRFRPPYQDFLLRTSFSAKQSKTVSTLFNNGDLRYKKCYFYRKQNQNDLRTFVHKCHNSVLKEMKFFFKCLVNHSEFSFDNQFLLAKALIKRGFYREVINLLQDLLVDGDAKSRLDQILILLGDVSQNLGQDQDASIYFQNAIKLKPEYPDYYNRYGDSLLELNKTSEALNAFQKAVELSVYYAEAYFNLGLAYIQSHFKKKNYSLSKKFPDSAIGSFQKAVELNPAYYTSNFITGRTYLDKQEWGKAYLHFLSARNEVNNSFEEDPVLDFKIKMLKNREIPINGIFNYINKLETIEQKHPGYPDLLNEKGIAYFFLSKSMSELASKHFRRALEFNNNYQKAEMNLRMVENETVSKDLIFKAIQQ